MALLGLVVCGGRSSRMGTDKSRLVYHKKPQYEHVADMLCGICDKVLISCNVTQLPQLSTAYEKQPDLPEYADNGPVSAILTAFSSFPQDDLLVIGCDYPLLRTAEIERFYSSITRSKMAAAFYNEQGRYEPLLAWYSCQSYPLILDQFLKKVTSLRFFLENTKAEKYIPVSDEATFSADRPEDFVEALARIRNGFPQT